MLELIEKPIWLRRRSFKKAWNKSSLCPGVCEAHVIDFSPTNIAYYLNCPHNSDIEGTSLEEKVDLNEVAKGTRPPGDTRDYTSWCGATVSNSIHTRTRCSRQVYKAAVNQKEVVQHQSASLSPLPPNADSSAVTTSLDLLNQQLSSLLGIEVVLLFNKVEDLKGFKVKQLVPRGSLEELKEFQL
ncbi:hypothetical protein M9H77_35916 [Catharanthus roseus]|uniref:Uncharacterized protein n=1 Tax=Catharanthus roseus TaxID=4058 RepID=A0ACB9ZQC0_CATRO|nr:hypothetical protein M9H77_35916 [Catharanthus roseus]